MSSGVIDGLHRAYWGTAEGGFYHSHSKFTLPAPAFFVVAVAYYLALLPLGTWFGVRSLLARPNEIVDDNRRCFFDVIRRNTLDPGSSFFGLMFELIVHVLALPLLIVLRAIQSRRPTSVI